MKFLVDAQLPPALARWLVEAGCEAQAVRARGAVSAEREMCRRDIAEMQRQIERLERRTQAAVEKRRR